MSWACWVVRRGDRQPDGHRPPPTQPVEDPAGERRHGGHGERGGHEQQPGVERLESLVGLQEQRDVVEQREQAERADGDQHQRVRERAAAEHPHVDERVLDLELDDHEEGEAEQAHGGQDEHPVAGPPPFRAPVGGQHQRHQPDRDRDEPEEVERRPAGRRVPREDQQPGDDPHHADRHHHEEDQVPAGVLDQPAAHHRAERRGEDHAEAEQPHRGADPLRGHEPVEQRHRDHRDDPARHGLQRPERDQGRQVPRQPAQQ
jgi:hypothetical protein